MHAQPANRLEALQGFIVGNQAALTAAVFDTYPDALYSLPETIVSALILNLGEEYGGPVEQEPFLGWALSWVQREAERHRFTLMVYSEYALVIHAAIHKYRWRSFEDCGITHDDLFAEIILLVFKKAHELSRPGTAKLTTRLTSLVRKHLYFRDKKSARHQRLVRERVDEIPDAIRLSDEEIASMQPDPEIYEPGYSECALN